MKEEACGFCIFNNAAIAAEHALETLGLSRLVIAFFTSLFTLLSFLTNNISH